MPHALRRSLSVATATALAASALVSLGGADVASAATYPTINEFSNDTGGTDVEYVEVHAAPGTDLAGYSLVVVRGTAPIGEVSQSTALTGSTDADGLAVVDYPTNGIVNSTSNTFLIVQGPRPEAGTDIDADDDGTIDEGLALTVVDSVATMQSSSGVVYSETVLTRDFDGRDAVVGAASRAVDGGDADTTSDWVRNAPSGYGVPGRTNPRQYAVGEGDAVSTPGAPNRLFDPAIDVLPPAEPLPVTPEACEAPGVTAIGAVQGTGEVSPIDGQDAAIVGVVTGSWAGRAGLDGFVVQTLAGQEDADAASSEGIFVYDPDESVLVETGDVVRVSGRVGAFDGLTQIVESTTALCAIDVATPTPQTLSLPIASPRSYESMLVTLPQDLTIIEMFRYAQYGTVTLATDRQYQPTNVFEPGSDEAVALAAANIANRIVVDDASSTWNPSPIRHPAGGEFTRDARFRAGDRIANVTGVLDLRIDNTNDGAQWRIQPTQDADFTSVNARPEAPDVGGDVQLAAFNVLNYFTDLTGRGAENPLELERQQAKLVASILELDADIVGLMEIENGGTALSTLVEALNATAGDGTWAGIETGSIGTDAISTAIIYQPAAVDPVGDWAVLDETVDPRFDTARNRPALTQSFEVLGAGEVLTVSVNHLKSKGSSCAADGDPLDPDGQGECNGVRTQAATALGEWLATDPTESGSEYAIILGDMNSYANEDPIVALETAGYVDLLEANAGTEAYTYLFDGQLGYIDYAIANAALAPLVTGGTSWHANADEPSILDYQTRFKPAGQQALYADDPYRASDHDAVVVGVTFDAPVDPEPTDPPVSPEPTDPAPPAPTDGGTVGDDVAGGAGSLPTTGGGIATWLLAIALALIAAGAFVGIRRARRATAEA